MNNLLEPRHVLEAELIRVGFCPANLIFDNVDTDQVNSDEFLKVAEDERIGVIIGLGGHRVDPPAGDRSMQMKPVWTIGLLVETDNMLDDGIPSTVTQDSFSLISGKKFTELMKIVLGLKDADGCYVFYPITDERGFNEPDIRSPLTFFPSTWENRIIISTN